MLLKAGRAAALEGSAAVEVLGAGAPGTAAAAAFGLGTLAGGPCLASAAGPTKSLTLVQ